MPKSKPQTVVVSLTATLMLPPKTPRLLPPWVWKWWKETLSGARRELELQPVGAQEIAWRVPAHSCISIEQCDCCCWSTIGYEEVAISIGLG